MPRHSENLPVTSRADAFLDVDLESSVLTNAFPVHRLGIGVGRQVEAPAAYVRCQGLAVDRLE